MKFHPYEPFDNNKAQKIVWEALKKAFKDDVGVAYYRYPAFTQSGQLQREPDILMLHRELGLWIIECKGCQISNIKAIQGHEWQMHSWCKETETPVAQAKAGMFVIKDRLTVHRQTRGLLSFHFRVALPFISRVDWAQLSDLPSTGGAVLVKEDLSPAALKQKITEGAANYPQRPLSDQEWEIVQAVLGGTLPTKEPRAIATDTPPTNPVRVIQNLESRLKCLDEQQQKGCLRDTKWPTADSWTGRNRQNSAVCQTHRQNSCGLS